MTYGVADLRNDFANNIEHDFILTERWAHLILHGTPVDFFTDIDLPLSPTPREWLCDKHRDGTLHEPGLVAWLLALRTWFSDRRVRFIDIGALYGYFTSVAARLFADADVISVEGNPTSAEYIRANVSASGDTHVVVENCLIDAHAGAARRYVISGFRFRPDSLSDLLFQRIVKNKLKQALMRLGLGTYRVERPETRKLATKTLSSFLDADGALNIVKIDTEGHQVRFLPRATPDLIAANAIVLLEFDAPKRMAAYGATNLDMCRPFLDAGYRMFWCDHRVMGASAIPATTVTAAMDRNSLAVLVPAALAEAEETPPQPAAS